MNAAWSKTPKKIASFQHDQGDKKVEMIVVWTKKMFFLSDPVFKDF